MQSALIVGASRGIGLGLATELARRGLDVVGTVRGAAGAAALRAAGAGAEMLDVAVALQSRVGRGVPLTFLGDRVATPLQRAVPPEVQP